VLLESVFISTGLALAAWVNLGMSQTTSSVQWRFPLATSAFWALIVIPMVSLLPESPRWLLKKGRTEEAIQVLSALEGVPEDDPQVRIDVEEITVSLAITGKGHFSDIFKPNELRLFNRACLAAAGQMFQQMSGMYPISCRDMKRD